jgi:two-component system, cell cycle sensor histidine kinase and response regulator CckA
VNPMLEHEGAGETILIVEDNSSARMALEALLEALGYKVIASADATEALDAFAQQADTVDLVMSDLLLPQTSGPELYDQLKQLRPDLPCIIMSGYPLEDESKQLRRHGINHWLQKPFNMRQLSELLHSVMHP